MSNFNSRFQILEKIGEGTFAEVFKCSETSTGQGFAVKRLKKDYHSFREAHRLSEIAVLRSLPSHPNVLTLVEDIFDPGIGKLYMIFELMEMNLYDLIHQRKRSMSEAKVKHLFYQILKGVDHLHSHGVFHRDIKPENILIKKSNVKIADLGSVRCICSPQPYTDYISTRWYRSPECILGNGTYGEKMDIWACGCVFYELFQQKPLFPGEDEIDQLNTIHKVTGTPSPRVLLKMRHPQSRVAQVKFPALQGINFKCLLPFTTETARDLLKKMLTYDPDIRSNVHRLVDHKYFCEFREKEYKKQLAELNPYVPKPYSIQQLNKFNVKTKPRFNIMNVSSSKKPGKLVTSSWGPETTAKTISATQSKSKPNNLQLLPKRRLLDRPQIQQKRNDQTEVVNSTKIPIKVPDIKSKTIGTLPPIGGNKAGTQSKSIAINICKPYNIHFLPQIKEK
ncbi:MAPK/MAK/MRK overlapping kinase-like [Macrosteles quadrilineatus]|uniref:MAPK/MAK/MRK overlapping kinase-like n=1 Tax=Macrosteles quadrilineatus TaxID=74068 RepID=UPI0023E2159C|nr:MAPK/MAK/MRK overlapping kinase-like [Macrosteles quadrilineatus]